MALQNTYAIKFPYGGASVVIDYTDLEKTYKKTDVNIENVEDGKFERLGSTSIADCIENILKNRS